MSEYVNRLIECRLERLEDNIRHTESQIEGYNKDIRQLTQYKQDMLDERDELRRELK